VRRNQQNTQQKEYYHHMGSGGYKSAIPKWAKMESDILGKGITPESINWPKHAKNCFFAHGGTLDLETRKLAHGPKLQRAVERFAYTQNAVAMVLSSQTERRLS
jgi:hypothetical protein